MMPHYDLPLMLLTGTFLLIFIGLNNDYEKKLKEKDEQIKRLQNYVTEIELSKCQIGSESLTKDKEIKK